jgi:hypothetical protein
MMDAICSSETPILTRATPCHIEVDGILHRHRHENLKSYKHLLNRKRCQPLLMRMATEACWLHNLTQRPKRGPAGQWRLLTQVTRKPEVIRKILISPAGLACVRSERTSWYISYIVVYGRACPITQLPSVTVTAAKKSSSSSACYLGLHEK